MKIRVLSDLHTDLNRKRYYELSDKDVFTVICGDISGSVDTTCRWLDDNVNSGLFVAGNHMFYNEPYLTIEQIQAEYAARYPLSRSVSFLNNDCKIADDVVFAGATLWTDYALFGTGSAELYKYYATRCMNDFRYGYIEKEGEIEYLTPDYCEASFIRSIQFIKNVCEKYPDKTVVVITHHAPSAQSLVNKGIEYEISPSYASDLENFILSHPNIKLWCHGHIHSFSDYRIGNCRVVCNPRGYEQYGEKTGFRQDFIIDLKD